MNEWKRVCPKCGKDILYISKRGFVLATRNDSWCHSCWCIEREKKKDKSLYTRPEVLQKISTSLKIVRKDVTKYGDAFKEKCRKNRAIQLQKGIGGEVNYNPVACSFIDKLNMENGWNLVHALSGGEKMVEGFFLDGYDEQRKIAFEYDEPKHHTLGQIKKDTIKKNVVMKYLSPVEFWRYDEKNKTLYNMLEVK